MFRYGPPTVIRKMNAVDPGQNDLRDFSEEHQMGLSEENKTTMVESDPNQGHRRLQQFDCKK